MALKIVDQIKDLPAGQIAQTDTLIDYSRL